jgi:hypothetical protein
MTMHAFNPVARRRPRRLRRLAEVLALAGVLTAAGFLAPSEAFAIASETPNRTWQTGPMPPPNPSGKEWQDGRVYAIARGAGRIYVGGAFTQALPPWGTSGSPVPRSRLLALNADTGELDRSFDATLNGDEVRALAVSPDGTTLYVGGRFTAAGGAPAKNLAALDTATGRARAGWKAGADQAVLSLAARGSTVFVGGKFNSVTDSGGTHSRPVIAALNAATGSLISGWHPQLTGCANNRRGCVGPYAEAMALSTDGATLYVGGAIDHADGHACTVCAIDPVTGAVDSGFTPANNREVFALTVDSGHVYAALGGGGGAGMAFDADTGRSAWEVRGDGNFQGVAVLEGIVYFGGHFGDAYTYSVGGTRVTQVHRTRKKIFAVDASTGGIDPGYDPVVNSPLGIFVLVGTPGHVDIGGDFTTVAGVHQAHYAELSVR